MSYMTLRLTAVNLVEAYMTWLIQANSMPSRLDTKIYSLTFKLLFTSDVGDKLPFFCLASSRRHRVGPFPL